MMMHSLSSHNGSRRRGAVLLAVLVVIVLLSLAAYQYSDLMLAEFKASDNYHKTAQAKAFADSGVHYAAAMLSNPDNITNLLNDNPFDNADLFRGVTVGADEKAGQKGVFSLIAPVDPSGSSGESYRFGVIDEGGKININAVIKRDPKGEQLYNMLSKLPNMTEEIANSIVDWVDTDTQPRQGGAEGDYYSGQTPSYRCKNGPLDSIEELLLVKGVTPGLLFGNDFNRNGIEDPDESGGTGDSAMGTAVSGTGGFDRGWSAYLTIYSREQNADALGVALTNLNDSNVDLETFFETLAEKVGDDLAKFIVLYRQYGATTTSSTAAKSMASAVFSLIVKVPTKSSSSTTKTVDGKLSDFTPDFAKKGSKKIKGLFDLVNAQVTVPNPDSKKPSTLYKSPLSDVGQRKDLMPKLFEKTTVIEESEIPARININTAPREVLAALPDLTEADVEAIVSQRPQYSSGEAPAEVYKTPTWLVTEANLKPETLSKVEKMITTRSQVYRVQALGYFDGNKGPVARVEAIIDTNGGFPRILSWRDMSDFGKVRPPQ